ncbi:MAG: outer membrane protein assembly factor BamA [Deltaproteobacteria bacterium]|nr:outer membrane protein assembly factor BamA [Deltaproteobacteria bacterium]
MKKLATTALAIFFVFLPLRPALPDMTLSEVSINVKEDPQSSQALDNMAPFKKGDRVTISDIDAFITTLKGLNLYTNISYKTLHTARNHFRLHIDLTKAKKVRDVIIKGNYPLLDKDITKLIPLQPGNVFDEGLIETSQNIIKEYLEKHGYYESRVLITPKAITKHNAVDLVVKIKKGVTYRIGTLTITGDKIVRQRRIKNKFKHLYHFKMVRFKKDLKRVQNMYARKGYIKARIKPEGFAFNKETKKVDIQLDIRENKRLKLNIAGKTYFKKSYLKDIIGLKSRRSYDSYAIKTGRQRLEKYYRTMGFPNATVTYAITKKSADEIIVKYTITPGKRIRLNKIKFSGNKEIKTSRLKKKIRRIDQSALSKEFFDEKKLLEDRTKLLDIYKKNGFFDTTISLPDVTSNTFGDLKTARFSISEGEGYRISDVAITSEAPVDQEELLKKIAIKTLKIFNEEKITKAKIKIIDTLNKQGYPYAEVTPVIKTLPETRTVKIIFDIKRGPIAHIRSIMIDGIMVTKKKTVLRNIKVKEGQVFFYPHVLDSQLNLRKLGVFSSVRIIPLGFEKKSKDIDLLISLTERKPIIANIQGGFDSRHLATGELNITKLNIFGSGHQFGLRAIGGHMYSRGEATLLFPRIFGASWNLINQYFVQYENEPNYNATSYGGFFSTLKNFGPQWTIGFKEQVTRTDLYEGESNIAALGNALFDNTFNEFQFSTIYDKRDNFSDPQRGIYALIRQEITTDFADARNNFYTYEINANHYHGFLKRFTLVNTVRLGHTVGLTGTPRIPANKLFFLGGSDTLRGFTEDGVNPSGGTVMFIYNGELQLRMTDTIKIAGFADVGALSNNFNQININNFRESAGVGIRYFTPIGPIRLDWGHILDRQGQEPKNRFHFSFGYFF